MRGMHFVVGALIISMGLSGCGFRDRQWGSCAVAGAVIGAAAGGIAGGVVVNNSMEDASNGERGGAIGGGVVGGALVGGLLGHAICDPIVETQVAQVPPPAPTKLLELKGPHFDTGKATLKPAGKAKLDEAVAKLKADANLNVSVEGHTDDVGSDASNQALSERRAQAVRDYLVAGGIASSRLSTKGFGESRPVGDNTTAAGREENRRVELIAR